MPHEPAALGSLRSPSAQFRGLSVDGDVRLADLVLGDVEIGLQAEGLAPRKPMVNRAKTAIVTTSQKSASMRLSPRPERSGRMTRPKRPSRAQEHREDAKRTRNHDVRDHVLLIAFMVAVTLGAVFYVVPIMLQETHDELTLKAHGADSTGVVVSTRKESGRRSSTYYATFAFRRTSDALEVIDEAKISRHEYYSFKTGTCVPVVYDPQRLSVAAVNIGDEVRRRHPIIENALWGVLLFVILALAWVGCVGSFVLVLQARRRSEEASTPD